MKQKNFKQLYKEHKEKLTDKWSMYLDEWDGLFEAFRDKEISLLEVGIQNGGSLEIWSKYFLNAKHIVGCDIDINCNYLEYADPRISLVIGDINSDKCQQDIQKNVKSFDIFIDDGSHTSGDTISTFSRYFKNVKDGGLYIVEDLHCSYWKDYGGGLYEPYSSISFFKRLADIINYEHWRISQPRKYLLNEFSEYFSVNFDDSELSKIHSIEFVNSLCVIKKLTQRSNELGNRVIAGNIETYLLEG